MLNKLEQGSGVVIRQLAFDTLRIDLDPSVILSEQQARIAADAALSDRIDALSAPSIPPTVVPEFDEIIGWLGL